MALVTEDGSGMADADSFVSVADADAYLAARGYTLWATLMEAEKEQAIRRAADHMEQAYGQRWKGERASDTQALSWPRSGIDGVESDSTPLVVAQANALLAFKAAAGDLSPDVERVVQSESIGPISTTYAPGSAPWTKFRSVDNMLASLLKARGITLVRA